MVEVLDRAWGQDSRLQRVFRWSGAREFTAKESKWLAFKNFRTEGWPAGLMRGGPPGWNRRTRSGRGPSDEWDDFVSGFGAHRAMGSPSWRDRSSAFAGHGRQLSARTCTAGPRASPWLGPKGCGIFLGAIFSFLGFSSVKWNSASLLLVARIHPWR